jgi:dTDP-4-amino-4,6-dideoxygalactose transaminase
MSEVDCAHMMVKLQYFDEWQSRRTKIAEFYNDCLHPYADCPKPNPDVVHAWHKYVIKVADQTKLQDYLKSYGIETKIHYPTTLPEMIAFRNVVPDAVNFPIARILSHTSLSLPIYPEMTDSEVENVVKTVQAYYG